MDCGPLGTRCFFVAGMEKDEGNGNGAVNKRQLWAMRDGPQGLAFMCAAEYTATSRALETTGQNYGELAIDRSSSVQVVGRKPLHGLVPSIRRSGGISRTSWSL